MHLYVEGFGNCGGTLIHREWILTAAHCVVSGSTQAGPTAVLVTYGSNTAPFDEGSVYVQRSINVIRHQDYNATTVANDIALIQVPGIDVFTGSLVESSTHEERFASTGQTLFAVGWGRTKKTDPVFEASLQKELAMSVSSSLTCFQHDPVFFVGSKICADTAPTYASGPCQGDSGGPLLAYDSDYRRYVVVGILSYFTSDDGLCAPDGRPSIYATRVSQYLDWIGQSVPLTPQVGFWWNPDEPGSGYSLEVRGGKLFFAAFVYDTSGHPKWYLSSGTVTGGVFSGHLSEYCCGSPIGFTPYAQARELATVGTVTIRLDTPTRGTLTLPGRTTAIQRFEMVTGGLSIGPGPTSGTAALAQSGWWWDPTASGSGVFLEIQQGSLFLAVYSYDEAGRATWYTGFSTVAGDTWSSQLIYCENGQTVFGRYVSPQCVNATERFTVQMISGSEVRVTNTLGYAQNFQRFTSF